MFKDKVRLSAVIDAGIAGSGCRRALTLAGRSVHMVDKSHAPGGRLATRRVERPDRLGRTWTTRLGHVAVGITARFTAFHAFADGEPRADELVPWAPVLAPGSLQADGSDRFYVPVPDTPALCRHQLVGVAATPSVAVDGPHKGTLGWQVQADSGWSRWRLEQPTTWVQKQMRAALVAYPGRPVDWHHRAVHRCWRKAVPYAQDISAAQSFWSDATQGVSARGDFLGGSGAEGAWLSAQSLSAAMLQRGSVARQQFPVPAAHEAAHQTVRHLAA